MLTVQLQLLSNPKSAPYYTFVKERITKVLQNSIITTLSENVYLIVVHTTIMSIFTLWMKVEEIS